MGAQPRDHDSIRMIRDSAAAVAPRGGSLARVRALRFTRPGIDRTIWREIAALGWLGLRVDETEGGAGLGMAAFCALAEEVGAGVVPEPLVGACLAARLLGGQDLADLLGGDRIVLPAWQERANTLDGHGATSFRDGRLDGVKAFVPMALAADAFLVTTRHGPALVEADAPGLHLDVEMTQDGGHFGTLHLAGAPARPASTRSDPACPEAVGDAIDEAALATAACMLGVMDAVFALTLDYLRTRRQFGQPLASFQALQHKAADLKLQIELTRASVASAAALLDAGVARPSRQAAVSRAKARASDAGLLVTRQAVQLHGGIGYTDEHDCGLYLRRAMVLANLYGSAALHRARFAANAPEADP